MSTKQNLPAADPQCFARVPSGSTPQAAYEASAEANLGSSQRTFTKSSTWGFQPNSKPNEGCTRVNSSYPDRDAQQLFLRALWTHLTSRRPRSVALRELLGSLGNTAASGTQHCHELLQWGGARWSWTEDGTAGTGILLLPSWCPLQVAASSLTRA